MNTDDLKKQYGDEYPAAVLMDGIRVPLSRERRFWRSYHSEERKSTVEVSRFMDGSASMTAEELAREWPTWAEQQRVDFCQSCDWLHEQSDYPEMLRFIMQNGGLRDWSGMAMAIASRLPCDEAFDFLLAALRDSEIGHSSNFTQAIGITKHPEAEATMRRQLEMIWAHGGLWDDDPSINRAAFDATTCITHLIEIGAPASDFEAQVRRLLQHVCLRNRDICRNFLSKYYSWL
ncbi:MAG: hypothetical protein JWR26_3093 [Pedosphaera sp.]|nr:hypothetical protein [Pedosphaera sp.]